MRGKAMINLRSETVIGLREATKFYPSFRQGKATHISTPLRHITKGTKLSSGEIVHLEGARLGGRWITSVEAVQRFVERLTRTALGGTPPPELPTAQISARRQRELAQTDRELNKAKI
jgi:hypothetical protein